MKIKKNYEGVLSLHKSTSETGIIIHSIKLTTTTLSIKRAKFADNATAEVAMLHLSSYQEEFPETLCAESLRWVQRYILKNSNYSLSYIQDLISGKMLRK